MTESRGEYVADLSNIFPYGSEREQIVRCKDCKYKTMDSSDHEYREPLYCGFHRMDVKPDNYCSWGKRRADA